MKKNFKSPDYLCKSSIYQMILRNFTPEGTIKSAESELPFLAGLGFDIIYLCPIFEADNDMNEEFWSDRQRACGFKNPKNPYRMKDYFKIDEEYGTAEDLKSFIKTAHSLKMRVILDLVYLHCGPKSVLATDFPDYVEKDEDGNVLNAEWHFPKINYKSDALREYLWSNMEYYIRDFDADGYRCDVGDGVPLDFWHEGIKRIKKIKPDIIMLNEGYHMEYLTDDFDCNYGFFSYNYIERAPEIHNGKFTALELKKKLDENLEKLPENALEIHFIENHDTATNDAASGSSFEKKVTENGVYASLAFMYFSAGVPFIYNGCEIANKAPHSLFANRFCGRLASDWSVALTERGRKRMEFIKRLNFIKHTETALQGGGFKWIENSCTNETLAFEREKNGEKIAFYINLSNKSIALSICEFSDIIMYQDAAAENGQLHMSAHGFAALRVK